MENYFEEQIESKYKNELSNGLIKKGSSSDGYFLIIGTQYPIEFNCIKWPTVTDHKYCLIDNEKEVVSIIMGFLNTIEKDNPSVLIDQIVLFGDNIDESYIMGFETMKRFVIDFFEIPQQSYALFLNSRKCLNFAAFNNEIFFG